MIAQVLLCVCAMAARARGVPAPAPGVYDAYGGAYVAAPAPLLAKHIVQPLHQIIKAEPIDPNPAYSFSYGVNDPHTGDHKDAAETLHDGVVQGSYSLVEPDGHLRKVTYTADKINGFNAVVERTGAVGVAPVAKIVAPAPLAVAHPWG